MTGELSDNGLLQAMHIYSSDSSIVGVHHVQHVYG